MIDLSQFPELYVRQEIEHLEVFTGFETANRYSVRTPSGEQLLYAFEESSMLVRTLLKTHRPLDIHVVDRNNTNVITASRSFTGSFPTCTSATDRVSASARCSGASHSSPAAST